MVERSCSSLLRESSLFMFYLIAKKMITGSDKCTSETDKGPTVHARRKGGACRSHDNTTNELKIEGGKAVWESGYKHEKGDRGSMR